MNLNYMGTPMKIVFTFNKGEKQTWDDVGSVDVDIWSVEVGGFEIIDLLDCVILDELETEVFLKLKYE